MLPLLFFYIMTVVVLVTRIYSMIFIVKIHVQVTILVFYFPTICRIVVGYTQVWTIIELTIRVN